MSFKQSKFASLLHCEKVLVTLDSLPDSVHLHFKLFRDSLGAQRAAPQQVQHSLFDRELCCKVWCLGRVGTLEYCGVVREGDLKAR